MIIDLQRRLAEVGRIRIGQQIPIGKSGKTRPAKLDTFRLTSPDQQRITAAAKIYGGTVQPWQAPAGPQWEVVTEATTLPVIVPPTDLGFSQWYELWSGGGCLRRCDGRNATYSDNGNMIESECLCDPDQRECQIHTRLSVMLRDLAGLGLWRLDSQGWNAALELQGAVDLLQMAAGHGTMLPAQLRLEQRMVKRPGQQTRRFAVPVLDVEITPAQLIGGTPPAAAIEAPSNNGAPLTPVPADPDQPDRTIAEQIKPPDPPRRRGQVPIPATGLAPRTTTQATEVSDPRWPTPLPADVINTLDTIDTARDTTGDDWADHPPISPGPGQMDLLDEPTETRMATPDQLKKIATLLRLSGFADHAARHDFVSAALGHPYDKPSELTLDEASNLIDVLESDGPRE